MSRPPDPKPFPDPTASALRAEWRARGVDAAALEVGTAGTVGEAATMSLCGDESAYTFALDDAVQNAVSYLGRVLGQGGMGVVRQAEQRGLNRTVAVKQPQGDDPEMVRALLREAWISSSLEHPNIVPVHALAQQDGAPLILMKRIEGRTWNATLRAGERDLEWHLGVLAKVCHAVHFAHSRGVLHLDLKPDNVMVGEFGEVYLLDWGVAVSMHEEHPPWMPTTHDIRHVVGTPGYLSPEQAVGDGDRLGPWTDVYLLGATLYRVLAGRPLHGEGPLHASLEHAWASAPATLDESVPLELADIVRRATARRPADRFPTAEAFREAIEAFLGHRESVRLTEEARTRLDALERGLGDPSRTLAECRFGLEQALQVWPGNAIALAARDRLHRHLLTEALAARDLPRAQQALADLADPEPALVAAVDALAEALAAEAAAVSALAERVNPNAHLHLRARWALVVGGTWFLWNMGGGWLTRIGALPLNYPGLLFANLVAVVIYAAAMWSVRDTILRNEVNRRVLALLGVALFTTIPHWVAASAYGLPPRMAVALSAPLYSAFAWSAALVADRRLIWVTLATTPMAFIVPLNPEYAFEGVAACALIMGIGAALTWGSAARR